MGDTLAILVGGGPAPGINGVIASATIEAINHGLRVIGIYDGYRHLAAGDTTQVVELTIDDVSRIHFTGGSILRTSRTNPGQRRRDARSAASPRSTRWACGISSASAATTRRTARAAIADARRVASASRPSPRRSTTICRCPTTRRRSASRPRARSARRSSRT